MPPPPPRGRRAARRRPPRSERKGLLGYIPVVWLGLALYLVIFSLLLYLIDRLAARIPAGGEPD